MSERPKIEPLVVPINQAATLLGVCRDTIYKMIDKGELRSVHAFKRHLVRRDSITEFLDRNETPAKGPKDG